MSATNVTPPARSEAADYYFKYIDLVPAGDLMQILAAQPDEVVRVLKPVSEDRSLASYGSDKWSVRQVVSHINDCERLFAFRAFWFARGFDSGLPSFDQMLAASAADADRHPLRAHVDEFVSLRRSTIAFFAQLSSPAWDRRGTASGNPFTVRALAFLAAGHVIHHLNGLRHDYGIQ
jgi:uncharacterized damage-inducible protein DinB